MTSNSGNPATFDQLEDASVGLGVTEHQQGAHGKPCMVIQTGAHKGSMDSRVSTTSSSSGSVNGRPEHFKVFVRLRPWLGSEWSATSHSPVHAM